MHGKRKFLSLKKAEIKERKRVEALAEKYSLLESTFDHLSPGISVYDADLRLVAFNQRYVELLDYPPGFVRLGLLFEEIVRFNAERGEFGPGDTDELIRARVDALKLGKAHRIERIRPNGTVLVVDRNPLPNGGWVSTHTDITELKRAQEALQEALEQQTATSEILRTISSSPTDLAPVFNTILANACRLCEANLAALWRYSGEVLVGGAHYNASPEFAEFFMKASLQPGPQGPARKAALERRTVHVTDLLAEPGFSPAVLQLERARTVLAVPLLRENVLLGVITMWRREVRPFTEQQIALVQTFADQAVIAIENARLFQEIEEKSRQIEIASKHKSQFLANMSHELRTPLSAIIGFTELVMTRSKDVLPGKQYANLERILMNAQHLLSLINEILDLSKIEAGRIEIHPAAFALEPLVDLCLRTVEPLVKSDRLRLIKEIEPNLPTLFTDEDRLKQILINLLSNAVKFTKEGAVTVTGRCQNREIVLAVQDTGIGIPEQALAQIFEEFHQVDSSSTRQYGGTGLGLAITRHLTQLLGGDITVQSRVGAGSTFTVRLPQHYAAGEAEEPAGRATEGCESQSKERG